MINSTPTKIYQFETPEIRGSFTTELERMARSGVIPLPFPSLQLMERLGLGGVGGRHGVVWVGRRVEPMSHSE